MKMTATLMMYAIGLTILCGCDAERVRQDDRVLDAAEVKRLFAGNTVESYNLNTGFNSFTYYHPNGQALQERLWRHRVGSWELKPDGQICLGFSKKKLKCRHIVQSGGKHYKVVEGKEGERTRVVRYRYFSQGNALSRE